MSKKNKPVITTLSLGDKVPLLGNKHVSAQLASIIGTTKCDVQLATYDNGVKVLVKFPKVQETDIGGAFRITIPKDSGLGRMAITIVGPKLADQITFDGGLLAVNINAYATIGVYHVKTRSAQMIANVFKSAQAMRAKFAKIDELHAEISEISRKINHKCKY